MSGGRVHVSAQHHRPREVSFKLRFEHAVFARFCQGSRQQLGGDGAAVVAITDLCEAAEDRCPNRSGSKDRGHLFEYQPRPIQVPGDEVILARIDAPAFAIVGILRRRQLVGAFGQLRGSIGRSSG